MAAWNDTPVNSWTVYTTGEQNQRQHPQYRMRERYIKTKDPLPNMNYKQLEKALPESYDLPAAEVPDEDEEIPPELFEREASDVEIAPPVEKVPTAGKTPPKKKGPPKKEKPKARITLNPATGYVGDEITVEAPQGLPEIVEVQVNDFQADFVAVSPTILVFEIPVGGTSGPVKLVSSDGDVINAGTITIVNG